MLTWKVCITTLFMCSLLSACMLFNPEPTASISIHAVNYLNPDANGKAAPIVADILQLRSDYSFKRGSYDALAHSPDKLLGNALIDKRSIEIRPNERKTLTLPLLAETKFIAVVADYRDISHANWQAILSRSQSSHSMAIKLALQTAGLSMRRNAS